MKITANPPSFVEAVGAGSSNNGGEEYSRMFDSAVRDAAKDSSSKLRDEGYAMAHRNSERAAKAASDADADRAAARRHSSQNATSDRTDTVADSRAVANDDDAASETVETRQDRRAAIDALDQLLRGAFGAPTLAGVAKAGSTSAAMSDDETLAADAALKLGVAAVIPDAEGVASKAIVGAEKTRGKVSLEVVHMETHFEPRSDAFVLVEGEAEGAKLASEAVVTPDRKGLAATARDAASELLAANEARAAAAGLGKTAASADGKAIAAAATSRNTAPNDAGSTRDTGPRLSFDEALEIGRAHV